MGHRIGGGGVTWIVMDAPPRNPAALVIGGTFNDGRYRILRCIARGGMGAVYEVLHVQTRRRRALKVMLPSVVESEEARSRFKLEATVVSSVESDHIAEVIDAGGRRRKRHAIHRDGASQSEELGELVDRQGGLPHEDVLVYMKQAAFALERTHAAGIVHRDLKPENLFVTRRDDGSPCVKLLDFGIAKVLGDANTQRTQGIIGTPLYISPEQVHGDAAVSARTDVYALAHIAYTLLVGEAYWTPEEEGVESVMPLFVTIMRGHTDKAVHARERGLGCSFLRALTPGSTRAQR